MSAKQSKRWKDLERTAALKLRGQRLVRQDFFESSPDVEVKDMKILAECKAYKRFSFHSHMAQAAKYCREGETPVLITKSANQIGEFATLPLDYLAGLLDEVRTVRRAGQ